MEERRRVPRNRTLKSGKIIVGADTSLIDCTVRNLSAHGALLLVPNLIGIPETFELMLDADRSRRGCRVIWHGANRIGVEFA
jgi:hypothetical protein